MRKKLNHIFKLLTHGRAKYISSAALFALLVITGALLFYNNQTANRHHPQAADKNRQKTTASPSSKPIDGSALAAVTGVTGTPAPTDQPNESPSNSNSIVRPVVAQATSTQNDSWSPSSVPNPALPTPDWSWTPYGHYTGPTPSPTPGSTPDPRMSPLYVFSASAQVGNTVCVLVNGYKGVYVDFSNTYITATSLGGGTATYYFDYSDGQSDGPFTYEMRPYVSGDSGPSPENHVFIISSDSMLNNMWYNVRVTEPNNISTGSISIPAPQQCYDAGTIDQ